MGAGHRADATRCSCEDKMPHRRVSILLGTTANTTGDPEWLWKGQLSPGLQPREDTGHRRLLSTSYLLICSDIKVKLRLLQDRLIQPHLPSSWVWPSDHSRPATSQAPHPYNAGTPETLMSLA